MVIYWGFSNPLSFTACDLPSIYWVRPMFLQEARNRFGAGNNLVAEMRLNDQFKYKNFFRMGPQAFEELLCLVGPVIKKLDVSREPINPATRLGITLRKHKNGSYISPRLIDSEIGGVSIPGTWRNYPTQFRPIRRTGANTYTRNTREVRDEYCRYFNEEGTVLWQWDHI
ncbi:hypothetical protein NQ314_015972 [Rhamnusium bicolor]|uniref:Uncharacterized protein n=1 Tax=Rhamnusium bicolor TaxID=1586634 RepID=A0AAV8WXK7_9CUCU|nr:hypothetical protein NQ314_015972 [Rhamnusium bicolor]